MKPALTAAAALAHPRVSGENGLQDVDQTGDAGSSPRERGKPTVS